MQFIAFAITVRTVEFICQSRVTKREEKKKDLCYAGFKPEVLGPVSVRIQTSLDKAEFELSTCMLLALFEPTTPCAYMLRMPYVLTAGQVRSNLRAFGWHFGDLLQN